MCAFESYLVGFTTALLKIRVRAPVSLVLTAVATFYAMRTRFKLRHGAAPDGCETTCSDVKRFCAPLRVAEATPVAPRRRVDEFTNSRTKRAKPPSRVKTRPAAERRLKHRFQGVLKVRVQASDGRETRCGRVTNFF